jgi:uncharacterized membrane protein HdeD (DUF308 family)
MYTTVLTLHSWIRWVALVAGVAATLGALRNREGAAERWGLIAMVTLDLQMLLGLVLYLVLSPFTTQAMADFAGAMKTPQLRFWAVEHVSMMFLAVILAHVGRVLARKAKTPQARRTRLLVCFGVATVAMFAAMPWPGMANGRPLFRGL